MNKLLTISGVICYDKTKWSGTQTLITPKGRETFRLLCQGL